MREITKSRLSHDSSSFEDGDADFGFATTGLDNAGFDGVSYIPPHSIL